MRVSRRTIVAGLVLSFLIAPSSWGCGLSPSPEFGHLCPVGAPNCRPAAVHRVATIDSNARPIQVTYLRSREVLFATNRALLASAKEENPSLDLRLQPISSDTLRYGIMRVSIPTEHVRGTIERPFFEYFYDWLPQNSLTSPNPVFHFMVLKADETNDTEFIRHLQETLSRCKTSDAFFYVHGIANTFTETSFRAAQLLTDIEFNNPGIFFSWPSEGSFFHYPADTQKPGRASPHFNKLIADLLAANTRINLIAHSQGVNLALAGLHSLSSPDEISGMQMAILAHGDINFDEYSQAYAPSLAKFKDKLFIFNSMRDGAFGKDVAYGLSLGKVGTAVPNACVVLLDSDDHSGFANLDYSLNHIKNIVEHARSGDLGTLVSNRCSGGINRLPYQEP